MRLADGIVEHHRRSFQHIPQRDFESKVGDLSARIPSLSDDDAIVALRGIAASIGDGHTFVAAPARPKLPIELCWLGADLTVTRATAAHRDLLGTRLLAIGDRPVTEVHHKLHGLIPQGENEYYVLARSAELLRELEVLAALGIAPRFRFATNTGREITIPLAAGGGDPLLPPDNAPLPMQRSGEPFWFARLPEHDTVYVQFRSYANLETTAAPLFAALAERPASKLIIDLRQNGGGNFWAGRQWLLVPVHRLGLVSG